MNSQFEISEATAGDLDRMVEIENGCFDQDAFTHRQLSYLINHSSGGCFVLRNGGQIQAYISLLTKRGAGNVRIYSVAVAQSAQGCGFGKALVDYAVQFAMRNGFGEVTLEVNIHNHAAISLYTKCGFVHDSVIANYYHDGSDAIRMKRPVIGNSL